MSLWHLIAIPGQDGWVLTAFCILESGWQRKKGSVPVTVLCHSHRCVSVPLLGEEMEQCVAVGFQVKKVGCGRASLAGYGGTLPLQRMDLGLMGLLPLYLRFGNVQCCSQEVKRHTVPGFEHCRIS